MKEVELKLASAGIVACVKGGLDYNVNIDILDSLEESARQKLGLDTARFLRTIAGEEGTPDGFADWLTSKADQLTTSKWVTPPDLVIMEDNYRRLAATQTIIIVAHSQGNFYANAAFETLTTGANSIQPDRMYIVSVATPDSKVDGSDPPRYTTLDGDFIWLLPGQPAPLGANVPIECGIDVLRCHSFQASYLKFDQSKEQILHDVINGFAANQSPVARFSLSADGKTAKNGELLNVQAGFGAFGIVDLNGDDSSDSDGSVVRWDWSIDGVPSAGHDSHITILPGIGTHQIDLTVTDDLGSRSPAAHSTILVSATVPSNSAPVAGFSLSVPGKIVVAPATLTVSADPITGEAQVTFADDSTDPDGLSDIVARRWTVNTGCTSIDPPPCLLSDGLKNFTWGFKAGGPYVVTLTVTDRGGLSSSAFASVTVVAPTPAARITVIEPATPVAAALNQAIRLVGSGFLPGLSIRVGLPGGAEVVLTGAQVRDVSSTGATVIATFADSGSYSMTVSNPDGSNSAPFNFTVTSGPALFFEVLPGCGFCLGGDPGLASLAVDSSQNVVASANFGCTFGSCGSMVVSISPSGELRWSSPQAGNPLAPDFLVTGPVGAVYYRDNLWSTTSLDANGETVPGWPITVPAPMDNANGLSVDADGTVLLHEGTIFSNMFVGWPSAMLALRPNGTQLWRTDFFLPTRGPFGDVTGPLFVVQPPFFSSLDPVVVYRIDSTSGAIVCETQTFNGFFTPNGFAWSRDGLFFANSSALLRFGPDCSQKKVFDSAKQFVAAWGTVSATVLASDFSLVPGSANYDASSAGLVGVSSDGSSAWTLDRVQPSLPSVTISPLIAADDRFFFVRGVDRLDGSSRIFVIDAPTGAIWTAIDASSMCPTGCSATVGPNHTLYVVSQSDPHQIYRFRVPVP
jgi:PKD repeat protein